MKRGRNAPLFFEVRVNFHGNIRNFNRRFRYIIRFGAATIIFAMMYWMISDQFRSTTLIYESSILDHEQTLAKLIEKEIKSNLHDDIHFNLRDEYLVLSRNEINILNASVAEDTLSIRLHLILARKERLYIQKSYIFVIHVSIRPVNKIAKVPWDEQQAQKLTSDDLLQKKINYNVLSGYFKRELIYNQPVVFTDEPKENEILHEILNANEARVSKLYLTDSALAKIQTIQNLMKGITRQDFDGFLRMLYLSTMTITTVGYGDIVPITGWARLLVSLEAILGITLLGLFVSDISRKARKGN